MRQGGRRAVRGGALGLAAALLLGGLALIGPAAAAGTATLSPQAGGRAVKGGSVVDISGTVPEGAVTAAVFQGLGADGSVLVTQTVPDTQLRPARPTGEYLAVDGTSLSGRLPLECPFSEPSVNCPGSVAGVGSVRLVVTQVGGNVVTSSTLRVDYTKPSVRGYELLAPDRVRVLFSEPVTHAQGDAATDWVVTSPQRTVTSVLPATEGDCTGRYLPGEDSTAGPTGCSRTLVLDRAVGEDEPPTVQYDSAELVVDRTARYTDLAFNPGRYADSLNVSLDVVRPAVPSITAVAGRATTGGSAAAPSNAPTVTVGGLTTGHTVEVTARAADGTAVSAAATATGPTAELTLPALPQQPEGTPYAVSAVAVDPATNRSDQSAKTGPRADGTPNPVQYVVDTVLPQLVSALPGGTRDVTVVLSEAVTGSDNPADWRIVDGSGRQVVVLSVSGTGDRRTLMTLQAVPQSSEVTYAPAGARYADRAGNTLLNGAVRVDGVDLPLLTDPVSAVLTRGTSYVVRGTAEAGHLVELFRDSGDDGTPDGAPLASQQLAAAATAFALPVELARNAATDLVVRVTAPTGGGTRDVPVARITHDDTAPTLTLSAPAGGEFYAGGSSQDARWTYADANPGAVRVELTLDGSTWRELTPGAAPGAAPGTAYRYALPVVSSEAARLRVTPRDAAGNVGASVLSGAFVVDALPPVFTARTVDPRTVRVVFAEAELSGSSGPLDWRVDGLPVSAVASSVGTRGETVLALTLAPGVTLASDATPTVTYAPAPTSTPYRDRAGQVVPTGERQKLAADGIAPAVPVIASPTSPVLTAESTWPVRGTAEPGARVELLDDTGRFAGTVLAAADGTWSVAATLRPDAVTVLRAFARDDGDNTSPAATLPGLELDATAPAVTVSAPAAGSRVEPGTRVSAIWRATDRNPAPDGTRVELSTDGGRTWRVVGEGQPTSGSVAFDVPDVRTGSAAVRVSVTDRVGRVGTGTSSPIGIGMPAATPSPTPSATLPPVVVPLGTFTSVTPARLLDTRDGTGVPVRGAVRPGGVVRVQVTGRGGVPAAGVAAAVVNVTAVQAGAKTHVTVVPTGGNVLSTASLTVPKGETVANLVTARLGADGALLLRNESGSTHLLLDVLGWYAASDGALGAAFSPLAPQRLLDTRAGTGAPRGVLRSGRSLSLQVTGRGGVPASGVTGVVLGVAAVGPTRSTHVTAWAAGAARPATSNLNVARGATRANLVTVPVGTGGQVSLAGFGADVHLVADVFGWYGPGGATVAVPVDPARLLDTRTGTRQPARAGTDLVLKVTGRGGVPATGVRAVSLVLTAVAPSDSTHVTAWGSGTVPATANLNVVRGGTTTSQVVVPVAPDGTVRLAVGKGRVHLVADVAAWFRAR